MSTHPTPADTDSVPCTRDPEAMFPTSIGPQREAEEHRAKAVCRSGNAGRACPVLDACLRYALRYGVDGIWASTTPEERQAIRERAGIVPLPVIVSPYTMRAYTERKGAA